jgi:ABC-2 type transport system ATP-binding protein
LRIRFWDWFAEMVAAGTSIIVTTHNISEASRCQNVVFLRNGRKLEQGTPQQLMDKYDSTNLEAAFVEATRSLPDSRKSENHS